MYKLSLAARDRKVRTGRSRWSSPCPCVQQSTGLASGDQEWLVGIGSDPWGPGWSKGIRANPGAFRSPWVCTPGIERRLVQVRYYFVTSHAGGKWHTGLHGTNSLSLQQLHYGRVSDWHLPACWGVQSMSREGLQIGTVSYMASRPHNKCLINPV